ncbi:hypothetical protein FOMPIDRAFT_1048469 [Fomitopsis schrenkii]|uniref:Uncharacterized protein n=1 Tax=Fomitopsis schrenkii TaxID=2126942 RepID=S8EA57_FOMSC|nr:hypothetical protein FOMPIDRAFT_1048469 [Fomitopsis schrenkii]
MNYVAQVLLSNESRITQDLGSTPSGYILVTDKHTSKSDSKEHYTVDAFLGKDASGQTPPSGCVHVYMDNTYRAYTTPRSKAVEAYENNLKAQGGSS